MKISCLLNMINKYPLNKAVLQDHIYISTNAECLKLLKKNRISINAQKFSNIILSPESVVEPFAGIYQGNYIPTIGSFSYSNSELPWGISIGRYCSIAKGLKVFGADHFIDWISTSPHFYSEEFQDHYTKDQISHQQREKRQVNIGNDVWIGEDVSLKKDITIGTGAIVAAKSVVTKDVPPYAIVAGIPARIIRYRFNDNIINKSLDLKWWSYHKDDLKNLQADCPESFLINLEKRICNGNISPYSPQPLTTDCILNKCCFFKRFIDLIDVSEFNIIKSNRYDRNSYYQFHIPGLSKSVHYEIFIIDKKAFLSLDIEDSKLITGETLSILKNLESHLPHFSLSITDKKVQFLSEINNDFLTLFRQLYLHTFDELKTLFRNINIDR